MCKKKTIFSILISFFMCVLSVVLNVAYSSKAEETVTLDISQGDIVITSTGYIGNGVTVEQPYTGNYIITGTSVGSNSITVSSIADGSNITLQDLSITTTKTSAISISASVDFNAIGDIYIDCTGDAISFNRSGLELNIIGEADIQLVADVYGITGTDAEVNIQCDKMRFDGLSLSSGSLTINANTYIYCYKDIAFFDSQAGEINLTSGGEISLNKSSSSAVRCAYLNITTPKNLVISNYINNNSPIVIGDMNLAVGGNVTINATYGQGVYGKITGTVGGNFKVTTATSPVAHSMGVTAQSVYIETTGAGECLIDAGSNNDVEIVATGGDITIKAANSDGGLIGSRKANLTAKSGNVVLDNNANQFAISGDIVVNAKNISISNLQSSAPLVKGNVELYATESIFLDTESSISCNGSKIVSFGDAYEENTAVDTYVIKWNDVLSRVYKGIAKHADISVTKNGVLLVYGSDYSMSYTSDNQVIDLPLNAGNYRVALVDALDNSIVDIVYSIEPYDITGAEIVLEEKELSYTGDEQHVSVIKVDDFLYNETDFSLVGNNATQVGDYNIIVSAKSPNFKGSATTQYSVVSNVIDENEDAPISYKIISGANTKWTSDSLSDIVIKADGEIDKFVNVQVDGEVLATSEYTVESGSTIVKLKPSYLNTLSSGKHILTIVFVDGTVSTEFEISISDTVPDTGDEVSCLVVLLFLVTIWMIYLNRMYVKEIYF